ncbi:MAG: TSUP family transporter [Phormidesmis sp. RL_2_1]|nr:TSUP family transporter [Phormidesmis sp. RL_2_1]
MLLILIFAIGLAAGFVDAIAGGGGLIMLPGLLFTGLPVSSAIATNKLCGTFGALTSSLKFAQSQQIDARACAVMGIPVLLGGYAGSRSIGLLPNTWAEPLVIVLMVAITLFVIFNPGFGMTKRGIAQSDPPQNLAAHQQQQQPANSPYINQQPANQQPVNQQPANQQRANQQRANQQPANQQPANQQRAKRIVLSILFGCLIGFHDGFFGPGTGVFLVFVLLSLWPLDFLRATGTAKVLNLLTNAIALATFATTGMIDYPKGLAGAFGVGIGSFLGATFATQKGAKVIKPIFIAVTTTLISKLLLDYATR